MARNPTVDHHRARKAEAVRRGHPERAAEADRDLRAAKVERYVRELVDLAPPLSAEQRARIAAVLFTATPA